MLDRDLLPSPGTFYQQELGTLKGSGAWKMARCCFHPDEHPSLAVNVDNGGFMCHGCGKRGGDLIDFVRQRDGSDFKTAVQRLGAWRP